MARWNSGTVVGLETGDRGFNPSRCTVECHLPPAVHTRLSMSPSSALRHGSISWGRGVNRHTVRHTGPVVVRDLAASA